jgi:hypothetical protein
MEQSRRNVGVVLVVAGLVMGCPEPRPEPEPFDGGTYVYDEYGTLERDPACKLSGTLELRLGEGDGTNFTPLAPGQEPVLYHGPQGGTHLILGVAVANPAVEFPGLKLGLVAESALCFSPTGCPPPRIEGGSVVVVTRPERFLPAEGGGVTVSGFLVVVTEWDPASRRRLRVEATDRCGRTGSASVRLGPPEPAP